VTRSEYEDFQQAFVNAWYENPDTLLKSKGLLHLVGGVAVKCMDQETLNFVELLVKARFPEFKVWNYYSDDGWVDARVFLSDVVTSNLGGRNLKLDTIIAFALKNNSINDKVQFMSWFPAQGGMVAKIKLPLSTKNDLEKRDYKIWAALGEISFRFIDLNEQVQTQTEPAPQPPIHPGNVGPATSLTPIFKSATFNPTKRPNPVASATFDPTSKPAASATSAPASATSAPASAKMQASTSASASASSSSPATAPVLVLASSTSTAAISSPPFTTINMDVDALEEGERPHTPAGAK
jgi:hypothetical protein